MSQQLTRPSELECTTVDADKTKETASYIGSSVLAGIETLVVGIEPVFSSSVNRRAEMNMLRGITEQCLTIIRSESPYFHLLPCRRSQCNHPASRKEGKDVTSVRKK